jgi:hypothetical protein
VIEHSDTEEVDAIPVLAEQEQVSAAVVPHGAAPIAQTAAVAAGGFVAGAAVLGLVHRRQRRRATAALVARRGRGRARAKSIGEAIEIVASRSLLVDVHLLGSSARGR